jgi:hypothetical protein
VKKLNLQLIFATKAIIVAIIDFGKLTNNATREPKRRGILAIKPQSKA